MRHPLLFGAVLALTPIVASAQSSAHLGVRGVVHREAVLGDPVGGALQLDFRARDRLDVRFTLTRASGTFDTFEGCNEPNVNCLPRAVSVPTQLTAMSVALPLRLTTGDRLSTHLVPEFDGISSDGTAYVGIGFGLEVRYRSSRTSPLDFVGTVSRSTLAELGASADAPLADGLTRLSVGVRYQFYRRR